MFKYIIKNFFLLLINFDNLQGDFDWQETSNIVDNKN